MYKKVFEAGNVFRSQPLTLRYCSVEEDVSRLGFIIRKKVGDAPMRNSIRRTLRNSFQQALPELKLGTWIVFDVSNKASLCHRGQLREEANRMLGALPKAVL